MKLKMKNCKIAFMQQITEHPIISEFAEAVWNLANEQWTKGFNQGKNDPNYKKVKVFTLDIESEDDENWVLKEADD